MLMKTVPQLEPMNRVRAVISAQDQSIFEKLTGCLHSPTDQPYAATVITNAIACVLEYSASIAHLRDEFKQVLTNLESIEKEVSAEIIAIQGLSPAGQMVRRVTSFEGWTLLAHLGVEATPLRIAIGCEITAAFLENRKLDESFCRSLRKDAAKYGRPQSSQVPLVDDLAELGFGRNWFARYTKTDCNVRRRIELFDPNPPERPTHARSSHPMDLLARLKHRFEYVNPKHRTASLDDSHVLVQQYKVATAQIRTRVEHQSDAAVVQALCVTTQLAPHLILSLPIVTHEASFTYLGINVVNGSLKLNLDAIFPHRAKPLKNTQYLFENSVDVLTVPLPKFLSEALQQRALKNPGATLLGDLVNWVVLNSSESVVADETCNLKSSLSRVSKSTGAVAIAAGESRLVAACLNWDFSLIGSARMYYARLSGKDIHAGSTTLYQEMGWGEPSMKADEMDAIGSRCVLTDDGVKAIFSHLSMRCGDSKPSRRATISQLLDHHTQYTRYSVALISFCLGLRESKVYKLRAAELIQGQTLLTLHDKQGGDRLMAQPAGLCSIVQDQVRQYKSHCQALIKRLSQFDDPQANALNSLLKSALKGDGLLFWIPRESNGNLPAGAGSIWGQLPLHLRVPANVGRHFWQNALRIKGLSSRDIDRYMRHRVVGLENNTNSQVASPRASFNRITSAQTEKLKTLGIDALFGLRKAKS